MSFQIADIQRFQKNSAQTSEKLFRLLDPQLNPQLTMVGFLQRALKRPPNVLVTPDDESVPFSVLDFKGIDSEIEAVIAAQMPDASTFRNKSAARYVRADLYKKTLRQCVEKRSKEKTQHAVFVGSPAFLDPYILYPILSFDQDVYTTHPRLNQDKVNGRSIAQGFLEATVYTFLEECEGGLTVAANDSTAAELRRDPYEILRRAGRRFMNGPAAIQGWQSMASLYDAFTEVSALSYEGLGTRGAIIISARDSNAVNAHMIFQNPIPLHRYREVRKVMEMSSHSRPLLCDGRSIYGLGQLNSNYDKSNELVFEARFTKHYQWKLFQNTTELMRVTAGLPLLPGQRIRKADFAKVLAQVLGLAHLDVDALWKLVIAATRQSQGALLAISSKARQEAQRLRAQALVVEPFQLDGPVLEAVCSIDGAVLIDEKGFCHAVGVILDGLDSGCGDRSRGARYNSSLRYVESNQGDCILVTVSEDGMINILPLLVGQ